MLTDVGYRTEHRNLSTWLPLQNGLEMGCRDRKQGTTYCLSPPPPVLFVHLCAFTTLMIGILNVNYKSTLENKHPFGITEWVRNASTEWRRRVVCSGPPKAEVRVPPACLYLETSEEDCTSQPISGC